MGVNDCQSGMGPDLQFYSFTVQEHDCYCFRYVAKAKPTNIDSEENVLPTYKYVVSRLHGSWSNSLQKREVWGTMLRSRETKGEIMDKGDMVSWEREESQHTGGNVHKLWAT